MQNFSRTAQIIFGAAAIAMGAIVGVIVYLHPESLRSAPAWVVYLVALSFVCVGVAFIATALQIIWLSRWVGAGFVLCLLSVFMWIAFGPGERNCSVSIPFLQTVAPETACRGAFGIGSFLIGLFLVFMLVRIVRQK